VQGRQLAATASVLRASLPVYYPELHGIERLVNDSTTGIGPMVMANSSGNQRCMVQV